MPIQIIVPAQKTNVKGSGIIAAPPPTGVVDVVVVVAGPRGGVCLPPSPSLYEDFQIYQIGFEDQMDCVILYLLNVL